MVETSISVRGEGEEEDRQEGGQNKVQDEERREVVFLVRLRSRLTRVSLSSLSSILGLSSWQRDGDLLEQTLDVVTSLGRGLDGKDVELLRLLVELLGRDLPERDQRSKVKVRTGRRYYRADSRGVRSSVAIEVEVEAHLLSFKSVLFPTSTMITSIPRSFRTSSIHFVVLTNEARSEKVR